MYIPDSALTAIRESKISLAIAHTYIDKCERNEIPTTAALYTVSEQIEKAYQLLALILAASE